MKSRITTLTVALLLLAIGLFAQEEMMEKPTYPNLKKLEVGLFAGLSNYQGDLIVPTYAFNGDNVNFAWGAHLRYNMNPTWALRLNFANTTLSGDEINYDDNNHSVRAYNFGIDTEKTPVTEFGVLLEWDILGKRRYPNGGFKKVVSPYLFGGLAFASFDATPKFDNNNDPRFTTNGQLDLVRQDEAVEETSGLTIPLGGGLRFDLSENLHVDLEVGFRTAFTDYLDGISLAADPDDNDWYSFAGVNLAYRLSGGKDTDGDGIVDKKDECPTVPGLTAFNGCPDRDGDGVVDKRDNCPDIAGPVDLKGCPDTDGDGIVDLEDQCPEVAGGAALKGCPDSDGDGVIDMEDTCPNTPGLRSMSGCPDSDGDGIVDAEDKCPNEAGTAQMAGCPDRDTDGDGISDSKDACPQVAGIGAFQGCPDTDGDGVQDSKDKCRTTPGSPSNNGCPVIKAEDRRILNLAVQNVRFETSRATLKTESYPILDQVVDIMRRYPDYNVKVRGYTDDRGNAAANQTLSENRARTCANYLISKGITSRRISSQGYGETNPVATNDTPEGRRMNRRVEFDLNLR